MASRALHIYDLETLASTSASATISPITNIQVEPWQRRESSLKFMTRAVACMPNDAGYASSSIEGRVAVEWFDPSATSQARKYAFKCHRQTSPEGVDVVYPVNTLAFHPIHGTFASGGGDGFVALWDGVAKRRIRQYQRYAASVAALGFSGDGRYLAVAISPGFEDGKEGEGEGAVKVFVRELGENEAKGKGAKWGLVVSLDIFGVGFVGGGYRKKELWPPKRLVEDFGVHVQDMSITDTWNPLISG